MRHQKKGKLFSRDSKARKNLIRGLITALVLNGKIRTTEAKAKLLKRVVEKMINYARRNPRLTKQRLFAWIPNKKVVNKIVSEILPAIKNKKSGITKLIKLGERSGDQAEIVEVEWTIVPKEQEIPPLEKSKTSPNTGEKKEKNEKPEEKK